MEGWNSVSVEQTTGRQLNTPPVISAVIPTHRRADLIGRAVRSVQAQTYPPLEIIVVSDGPDEDTARVVGELSAKDPRIRFEEYAPAWGGNYARNLGAGLARGTHIAFLDDDDEWFPEKLARQAQALASQPGAGLCCTGCQILYVSDKADYQSIPADSGDLSRRVLLGNCIGTTSTVVVDKAVFEAAGGFDETLEALQDYELWIRICQLTRVAAVREPLIRYYNYRNAVQISASTEKYIRACEHINRKHADKFAGLSEDEMTRKRLNEYFLVANKAMRNGSGKEARQYIRRANRLRLTGKGLAYMALSFFDYQIALRLRRFA